MFTLTECIGLCLIALFIGFCLRKPSWFIRSVGCTPATKDAEPSPYASWSREELERQLSQRWERIEELEAKRELLMADQHKLLEYFLGPLSPRLLSEKGPYPYEGQLRAILEGRRGEVDPRRAEHKQLAEALAAYVGGKPNQFGMYAVGALMQRHADIQQVARIHGTTTLLPLTVHESFDWPPTTGACPTCVKRITTHITETFGGQHVDASKSRSS